MKIKYIVCNTTSSCGNVLMMALECLYPLSPKMNQSKVTVKQTKYAWIMFMPLVCSVEANALWQDMAEAGRLHLCITHCISTLSYQWKLLQCTGGRFQVSERPKPGLFAFNNDRKTRVTKSDRFPVSKSCAVGCGMQNLSTLTKFNVF